MFDRPPGFMLPEEKRLKTALLDHVKSTPIERRMNAEEKKEWAQRRLARAKVIENLPEYRNGETDWKGEIPHNFTRHMREATFFDKIARTSHSFKGRRNQAWTTFETSITKTTRMIRFFTIRNSREVPFVFILEKSTKVPNSYDLTVKCGIKVLNRDKLDTDSKQFFASSRHLYDFVTTELWGHLDALPLLPAPPPRKNATPNTVGNVRRGPNDHRKLSNVPQSSRTAFGPSENSRRGSHNSSISMNSERKSEQGNFNNPRPPFHNTTNFTNHSSGPRNNNFGNRDNFPRNQPRSSNQYSNGFPRQNREQNRQNSSFQQQNSNTHDSYPKSNQEPMRRDNNNSYSAPKNDSWRSSNQPSNQNSGSAPKVGGGFGTRGGAFGSRTPRNNIVNRPN